MKISIQFILFLLFFAIQKTTGQVGMGTNTPEAALDITYINSGFLLPRMTTTQRDAIASPVNAMLLFNTTNSSFEVYKSACSCWVSVVDGGTTPASSLINTAPTASNIFLSGQYLVGKPITVNYTYFDGQQDPEGLTTIQWQISSMSNGDNPSNILGATTTTYTPVSLNQGNYIRAVINPRASRGVLNGVATTSNWILVEAATTPTANNLLVIGTPAQGSTLTASYTFAGGNGIEDLSPTGTSYVWQTASDALGNGLSNAPLYNGATSYTTTYIPQSNLLGRFIRVAARVKDMNGLQAISFVKSPWVGPVATAVEAVPIASDVTYSPEPSVGLTLTGTYSYFDVNNDTEGTSIYQWYLADDANGTNQTAISGATGSAFTVLPSHANKFIGFSVKPVALSGNLTGVQSPVYYSSIVNVTSAPQSIVLSPSNSKILVQWNPIINATAYKLEYRIQGATNWTNYTTQGADQRGYEINGLSNGTTYEVQVSTINAGVISNPSELQLASPTSNPTTNVNNHILVSGQSLSLGIAGGVALTSTQPYNNKMLNLPSTISYSLDNGGVISETDYTGLIPLVEPNKGIFSNNLETPTSSMANMISSLSVPNSFNSILSLHGIGGRKYSELKKGGTLTSYENGQAQSKSAMKFSLMDSKGYKIRATAIIHGERDQAVSTPIATYEANLVEWQYDYEQDAKQLTGQSENVPLFINQNSSWTGYNFTTPTIAIAQLNATRNNPNKIYMTTPYYIFDYVDHAHIKNWGYRRAGEYFGKVIKKVLIDNVDWKPVMPTQIVRAGNIIEAKFHVPVAPLIFDTNAVVAKSNYGFEYFDATSSASISNVEIIGGDIVRITLNQIPTGSSQKLRYAFTGVSGIKGSRNTTAPSGNLRDSDSTPALYNDANVPVWAGTTLPNWSVTFDDTIINAPSKPQNVSSIVSSGQITLSWVAPTLNGGSTINDYIIEYKTSSSNTWIVLDDGISNATGATISGTTVGANYNIRVSAVNSNLVKGLVEILNL